MAIGLAEDQALAHAPGQIIQPAEVVVEMDVAHRRRRLADAGQVVGLGPIGRGQEGVADVQAHADAGRIDPADLRCQQVEPHALVVGDQVGGGLAVAGQGGDFPQVRIAVLHGNDNAALGRLGRQAGQQLGFLLPQLL